MMMEKLNRLGEGDFTVIIKMLNSTAVALAQLMPKGDETQQMKPILKPKENLKMEKEQSQDNYINTDLSPRPGR
jgi:hypothetical protein